MVSNSLRYLFRRAVVAAGSACIVLAASAGGADALAGETAHGLTYPVVDTGQHRIYSSDGQLFTTPGPGDPYYGQDGQYGGNQPQYRDNGDGTVTDRVTGLMWQKAIDYDHPMTYEEAKAAVRRFDLAGHRDWRIPTIKELYSLINFQGHMMGGSGGTPFIDTHYFNFEYGKASRGERAIDTQVMSSTLYVGTTMHNSPTQFGVNFGDGRIKGYPLDRMPNGRVVRKYYRFVRGNPGYGKNRLVDNGDGTVSDLATGLMWAKADSRRPMNWEQALAYCEKLNLAGHHDWRLPNAKELQSIVDYDRAPDATDPAKRGPAIDPLFDVSDGQGWAWSSTTHLDGPQAGMRAVYIAFGEATGYMGGRFGGGKTLLDVHGAGAQRSDPKSGNPKSPRWARGFGPQGDVIRIYDYVRPVRDIGPFQVKVVQPDITPVPGGGSFRQRSWGQRRFNGARRFGMTRTSSKDYSGQSGGLLVNRDGAFDGYTLLSPISSTITYLIDNRGQVVHTWESPYRPGLSARLLPNGNLLRCGSLNRWENGGFRGSGGGGVVEEWDWDGNLVWRYRAAGADYLQNHDVTMLPNGNVLMVIWQRKSGDEAVAAGRRPDKLKDGELWANSLIEVQPTGKTGGRIVWRWDLWDHLVQEYDPSRENYGRIAEHPERLDINALSARGPASRGGADWTHANSVAYNPQLDQVLLSFRNTSEIYIIDHGTTSAEAAGHTGGRYGRGGDFLYRWGNPVNYGKGNRSDETLFGQHDASWISEGLPGAGHILVFNNGAGMAERHFYSNVLELKPPMDGAGHYGRSGDGSFAPSTVVWKYQAAYPEAFYSSHLGSAQRLANGNTLIDSGVAGIVFEVMPAGEMVWEYQNPHGFGRAHSLFDAFRYGKDYPGLRRLAAGAGS